MTLIQGSTYVLNIQLLNDDDTPIDLTAVEAVEFNFGSIVKNYPSDSVSSKIEGIFEVSLTQQDTFALQDNILCQFRVKYTDGQVKSTYPTTMNVIESVSRVEL